MQPSKIGQVVKFSRSLPGEDPNQLYVVVEIADDHDAHRALITPIASGLRIPPLNTVSLSDIEVVLVSTSDMIGEQVSIRKSDGSIVTGMVVVADTKQISLEMSVDDIGVTTNCFVTVADEADVWHKGFYFYRP